MASSGKLVSIWQPFWILFCLDQDEGLDEFRRGSFRSSASANVQHRIRLCNEVAARGKAENTANFTDCNVKQDIGRFF